MSIRVKHEGGAPVKKQQPLSMFRGGAVKPKNLLNKFTAAAANMKRDHAYMLSRTKDDTLVDDADDEKDQ